MRVAQFPAVAANLRAAGDPVLANIADFDGAVGGEREPRDASLLSRSHDGSSSGASG
jgi:hypothetical protein